MGAVRVAIEIGAKRTFASALDWPGWARGAKAEEKAIAALIDYVPRYAKVAKVAGVPFSPRPEDFLVIEHQKGDASTDYGVPGKPAALESEPMTRPQLDRMCALVEACWDSFDAIVKSAPAELRKGPRGGGRDRDKIVEHVLGAEASAYAPKLGLKLEQPAVGDRKAILAMRRALIAAFQMGAGGKLPRERGWTARYAARRIAWHALDHAWEIEDRTEP